MAHIDFVGEVALALRSYAMNGQNSFESNRLAKLGAAIVKESLCRRIKATSISEDTSGEQVSLSLLGGLFEKDVKGRSGLKRAIEGYLKSDDTDLFLRFQSVIIRTASQELFHRWKENDRPGSYIWRNLHHALRTNPDLILVPSDNPKWVTLADEAEIKPEMSPIDFNLLCQYMGEAIFETRGIGSVTIQILIKITENPLLMRAIRIEELFAAFRDVYARSGRALMEVSKSIEPNNSLFIMALEKASSFAMEKAGTMIDKYNASGKLPESTIRHFKRALALIIDDHSDGGICQSYYEYLKENWADLDKEDYRKNYRAKFEYLVETVLQEFNNMMRIEFYE